MKLNYYRFGKNRSITRWKGACPELPTSVYNQDRQEDRRELRKMGGADDPTGASRDVAPPHPQAGLSVLSPPSSSEKQKHLVPKEADTFPSEDKMEAL